MSSRKQQSALVPPRKRNEVKKAVASGGDKRVFRQREPVVEIKEPLSVENIAELDGTIMQLRSLCSGEEKILAFLSACEQVIEALKETDFQKAAELFPINEEDTRNAITEFIMVQRPSKSLNLIEFIVKICEFVGDEENAELFREHIQGLREAVRGQGRGGSGGIPSYGVFD